MGAGNQFDMRNPLTQYPRPEFPKQPQPVPGLAARIQPVPDHGETSYKGFGRLKGRKALITGGDSGIGRAAAIAFAREDADVVLNYLPEEQSDADEVVNLIEAEGRAFSKALSKQILPKGIRVNVVAQGPVWTPLQTSGGQTQDVIEKDVIEKFGSEVPMQRPGQPAVCAPLYVFLASQESSYITGEVFGFTGGNTLP